jgi:predicted phosphodiesterase
MRYGILSDIHANLEAYEAVISALKEEQLDKLIIVGDIVGYGADPKECISLTKSLSAGIVCGNHDRAAAGFMDTNWFNDYARKAVLWTQSVLSEEEKQFLREPGLIFEDENIIAVHGSLDEPQKFNYIFEFDEADRTFLKMGKKPCFIGHSHSPAIIMKDRIKGINAIFKEEVELEEGRKYIINVGSVGQPRDGDNRASYAIYDVNSRKVTIKRIGYDVKKAQDKILDSGLPEILAYRLYEGR